MTLIDVINYRLVNNLTHIYRILSLEVGCWYNWIYPATQIYELHKYALMVVYE